MSILKEIGECFAPAFVDDKFISSFLDKSGIHKKPDYQEEMAKAMKKLADISEQRLSSCDKQ